MTKKRISVSYNMRKGILDDDYSLYDDGSVLHEYDKSTYPGGQNLKAELTVDDLSDEIKRRLLEAADEENKEAVRKILKLA